MKEDRSLRVLLVTGMYPNEQYPRNGIAVQLQCESLRSIGIHIDVFHLRERNHQSLFKNISLLRKEVLEKHYDLVHIHYGIKSTLLGMFSPAPVVATYHGTDINGWTWKGRQSLVKPVIYNTAAFIVRGLSRKLASVIVMTDEMKTRLSHSVQKKTHVIPMGIDVDAFMPISKDEARKKLGWDSNPVVVFSNSNNEVIKRQDLAEEAMSVVKKSVPNVDLHVIHNVEHSMMPVILSAADCILITSDKEGAPNIVRESIACKLPIVSVPVGDIPAMFQRFPNIGVLTGREPRSIAHGVMHVLDSNLKIKNDEALEAISLQSVAKQIIEVYQQALEV